MKVSWPSHICSMHQSKRLLAIVGGDWAKVRVIIFELWENLTWSLESTGAAGYLSDADAFIFAQNLCIPIPNLIDKLVASGWLERQRGGAYCAVYSYYNKNLDASYLADDDTTSFGTFKASQEILTSAAYSVLEQADPLIWLNEDGTKRTPEAMRRCILLVKTLDSILGLGRRRPAEFDVGLVQSASRLCNAHPADYIEVVLLRLFQKKGTALGFPKRTSYILENFEVVCSRVAPPDGFDRWLKARQGHVTEGR